ncbi:MAG TPA: ribosome maturation factor RimP [Pseudobdellovibrionaceae bacterium]|nr:ribosome maturation factor RimP [Pseudobdellovibrionaceae bacterium]
MNVKVADAQLGSDQHSSPDHSESESQAETAATSATEMRWQDKLMQLATEVAQREGCELYDLEILGGGGHRVVRITIDREPGVSIDDCANVSRGLNLILDVEDLIPGGAYQLEVSSPGIERALRTPRHYQRAVGSRVQVKCFETLGALQALTGVADPTPAEAKALQHWGTQKSFEAQLVAMEDSVAVFEIQPPESKAKLGSVRSLMARLALDKIAKAHTVFVMEKGGGAGKPGAAKKADRSAQAPAKK